MSARIKNVSGQRFGKLVAIRMSERTGKHGEHYWVCKCDCGNETEVKIGNLWNGFRGVKSCGCAKTKPPAISRHGRLKSGVKREPLYNVWVAMKQRCNNVNDPNYFRYGGRGISVCNEWQNDYEAFRTWCYANGYEYGNGLELDREDNNEGYCPENCRFVTHRENLLNTHRAKKYKGDPRSCY